VSQTPLWLLLIGFLVWGWLCVVNPTEATDYFFEDFEDPSLAKWTQKGALKTASTVLNGVTCEGSGVGNSISRSPFHPPFFSLLSFFFPLVVGYLLSRSMFRSILACLLWSDHHTGNMTVPSIGGAPETAWSNIFSVPGSGPVTLYIVVAYYTTGNYFFSC